MKTVNLAIVAGTILVTVTILGMVTLVVFAPEGVDIGLLVGLLFSNVVTLLSVIVGLVRTEQVKGTVDDLANGKMDAKIRANVADVLPDHLVDPKARPQIERDRATRDGTTRDHS